MAKRLDNASQGNSKRGMRNLVRISAGIVIFLLIAYFVITLNNMSNITHRFDERRDGTYPVSIAAGHAETNLSEIRAIMQVIETMDSVSVVVPTEIDEDNVVAETPLAPTSIERHTYHFETVRNDIDRINASLDQQISIMVNSTYNDPDNINELVRLYDELQIKMDTAFSIWQQTPNDRTEVQAYIGEEVLPLLDQAIDIDNNILDVTTQDMDNAYDSVLDSIRLTIIFSLALILAIFLAMFVYISLLNRKEEYEDELAEHLKDALSVAQNANAAKSSFLSNMSHDIRTPLNAIIGLTVIAEDNIDDPVRLHQCLGQITTSSNHLLQLINDVLDMNRIESGKTSFTPETFSLPEMMAEVSTINETQIAEKELNAKFVLNDIKHEYVIGDSTRIRQILLNLTSNAIKYSEPGGNLDVVFTEMKQTRPHYINLKITVADTGIGMQPEFMEYIFEPFERERNETTNFTEGTGLGMAITKNLVTMMGGSISVESEPGEGTTFTVLLSLEISDQIPELDTASLKGVPILITSDKRSSLDGMCDLLEEFGMDTRPYCFNPDNIPELKHTLEATNASLVVADINTNDLSKRARVESVLSDTLSSRDTPLILAIDGMQAADKRARKAGVTAFIERPIFRSRLFETVNSVREYVANKNAEGGEGVAKAKEPRVLSGNILIVEDNELNREIASELIKKMGPTVETAADGVEAVQMVKDADEGHFDLIFMDWQMPRMNGIEATKTIVKFFKESGRKPTPIVAMTANAFNDNRQEALAAGMEGFMAKPINVQELRDQLEKYL